MNTWTTEYSFKMDAFMDSHGILCVCMLWVFSVFNTYFSCCKHFLIRVDGLATATTLVCDPKPAG